MIAVRWPVVSCAEELGFEAGDALVEEAIVGAGGLQALVQGAVSGGEVADALAEGAVLGGEPLGGEPLGVEPLGGAGVVVVPGVAELAEQFADAGALSADRARP